MELTVSSVSDLLIVVKLFGDSLLFLGNFTGPQETLRNKMTNRVRTETFLTVRQGLLSGCI